MHKCSKLDIIFIRKDAPMLSLVYWTVFAIVNKLGDHWQKEGQKNKKMIKQAGTELSHAGIQVGYPA